MEARTASRSRQFRSRLLDSLDTTPGDGAFPGAPVEERIKGAIFTGRLRPGDQLPSVRDLARACGASRHATAAAYDSLRAAGLVEARARSGFYVRADTPAEEDPGPDTARWLVEVLAQAFAEHRVKIPDLPDLVRRWTSSVPVTVACVESVEDLREALSHELKEHFGLVPVCLRPEEVADGPPGRAPDLVVTTSFHARQARSLGRPVVVARMNRHTVQAAEARIAEAGDLTVLCVDAAFGDRLAPLAALHPERSIRLVLADDDATVESLDRSMPVLMTGAARRRLGERADFRLVAPTSPFFSPEMSRALVSHVVRHNVWGPRARPRLSGGTPSSSTPPGGSRW